MGEKGTLYWVPGKFEIGHFKDQEFRTWVVDEGRNDMFMAMAGDFLGMIQGRAGTHEPFPRCNLEDGIAVMELIQRSGITA
jgi:hypothetical protein